VLGPKQRSRSDQVSTILPRLGNCGGPTGSRRNRRLGRAILPPGSAWLDQRRKFGQYPALCGPALPTSLL